MGLLILEAYLFGYRTDRGFRWESLDLDQKYPGCWVMKNHSAENCFN